MTKSPSMEMEAAVPTGPVISFIFLSKSHVRPAKAVERCGFILYLQSITIFSCRSEMALKPEPAATEWRPFLF